MDPFGDVRRPVVVGHRGAPRVALENTLEAFAAAAAAGAGWIELDVRRARGELALVHHDAQHPEGESLLELDRAAAGRLRIAALDDLVDALPAGLGVDVELKNLPGEADFDETEELARVTAAVLQPRLGQRPWLVSSFNPLALHAVREHAAAVPLGLLFAGTVDAVSAAAVALELGVDVVCLHDSTPGLSADALTGIHAEGLAVMVWTVDDSNRARELAVTGVDALCTNDPAMVVAALAY